MATRLCIQGACPTPELPKGERCDPFIQGACLPERRGLPRPDENGRTDQRLSAEEIAAGVTSESTFLNAVKEFAVSDAGIVIVGIVVISVVVSLFRRGYRVRVARVGS